MCINNQKGSVLLEGLISIMIFSFGLLGIAGYQTAMVKQTSNIQYRLQASLLVSSAMGEMEADPTLVSCFKTACPKAQAWFDKVAKLPGATSHPPLVETVGNGTSITVSWALPKENDFSGNPVVHSLRAQFASLELP
jgi:type IV pilus assembly protein PilV